MTTDATDLGPVVASLAAKGARELIGHLTACGLPLDAVLSGVLGEAVRTFARDQGWSEAAGLCEELARQARTLASPEARRLAAEQPAGRA